MNKTVLLVEDERRLREIVSDYFRNEGFEVIEAEDGKKRSNYLLNIQLI